MRPTFFKITLSLVLLFVFQISVLPVPVLAQSDEELLGLRRQIEQMRQAGKHADALPVAERLAASAEKRFGSNHVTLAASLNTLAILYGELGRLSDAEHAYKRTLAIIDKSLGPEHENVGITLGNLAIVHQRQGRYSEAVPLATRALAIAEKAHGPSHPTVAISVNTLASVYESQGRYAEAEPLYKRSLAIRENAFGPEHQSVGAGVNNLAGLYVKQGRGGEAEPLYKRALAIGEKTVGPNHPTVGTTLNNLGLLYREQGRYAEAEAHFKRDLAIQETLGLEHPNIAGALNNIGTVRHSQGRYAEALPLYERALTIREKRLGPSHPLVAESLINLAEVYRGLSRFAEADPLYRRGIAIQEHVLGAEHPFVGVALNNFAEFLRGQGRASEAEPLYKRSLAIREKVLGPNHPDIAQSLNNLALVYGAAGRFSDAQQLFKRALAILERAYGADHPNVGAALNSLAWTHFAQREWKAAHAFSRRAVDITVRRSKRDRNDSGPTSSSAGTGALSRYGARFALLVKAAHRLAEQERDQSSHLADEGFITAQWALGSAAAASLAQMSAREGKGSGQLARAVRERQDLVSEWQVHDKLLTGAVSRPANQRDQRAEEELRKRLAVIDASIAKIDAALAKEFPEYAALANPEPLTPAEAQAHLRPDEALVVFFDTPAMNGILEETFAWALTKTQKRLVRLEPGSQGLIQQVQALRCGLDQAAWEGEGASRCTQLVQASAFPGKPLPFDLARAHALYRSLFGQVEELIQGKHLLLVPSGALTSLPFQVLVTSKPASAIPTDDGYSGAAWLARRHAVTVLPSVPSLKALRHVAKASQATQPFIGFGNPLLLGPGRNDRRAWEHQSCKTSTGPLQVASRGVRSPIPKFFHGGLANVEEVRAQYPLPETADELCAVARSSGTGEGAVYLGAQFSEKTIKALSANGALASARVVHFATHGLLAGETTTLAASKAEPSLIMTPPQTASEEDDGLLTASEIAQLKLDADWVVLSACNTAAGDSDGPGAESLSGLARAFFYAGARAMLVSHWAVNSEATVRLITKAFDEIKADSKTGRAEALRRAMISLIATGSDYAHPANWAPFVVVGEGAN